MPPVRLTCQPGTFLTLCHFDDGPTSRTSVQGAPANVSVKFSDGAEKTLRFTPLCYNTSCLSLFDTPIVFGEAPHVEA